MAEYNLNLIDAKLKIIFVGDSSVGKTTIMKRILEKNTSEIYQPTVGVDFQTMIIKTDNHCVKFTLWDTAGQEMFRSIITSYFRNTACAFIVFDKTNLESFNSIHYWIVEVQKHSPDAHLVVIGNKNDSVGEFQVTTKEASSFCEKYNLKYIETSIQAGTDVTECCIDLATHLLKKLNIKSPNTSETNGCANTGFTQIQPGINIANFLVESNDKNNPKSTSTCAQC